MKRFTVCSCLLMLASASAGVSGSCSFGGDFVLFTTAPLHQANGVITISEVQSSNNADVEAEITEGSRHVELEGTQSVAVNGTELSGPDSDGEYEATINGATQYTVTITEPTRGVEDTTIDAPADFAFTSHAEGDNASLSGFTLMWTPAEAGLKVEVRITQRILGRDHEETIESDEDTGTLDITAADLSVFQQGADLTLTLTRINEIDDVAGFATSLLQVRKSVSLSLTPGP